MTRFSFGVFVGQHRALCLHGSHRREVLRGDHFECRLLTIEFGIDEGRNFGIKLW